MFQDTIVGSVIGNILAGDPITSYIIGGELLKRESCITLIKSVSLRLLLPPIFKFT